MLRFEQKYEDWLQEKTSKEKNRRRREILERGLGHGTVEFLRSIWYPAAGNFDHFILNGRCVISTMAIGT